MKNEEFELKIKEYRIISDEEILAEIEQSKKVTAAKELIKILLSGHNQN